MSGLGCWKKQLRQQHPQWHHLLLARLEAHSAHCRVCNPYGCCYRHPYHQDHNAQLHSPLCQKLRPAYFIRCSVGLQNVFRVTTLAITFNRRAAGRYQRTDKPFPAAKLQIQERFICCRILKKNFTCIKLHKAIGALQNHRCTWIALGLTLNSLWFAWLVILKLSA